MKKIHKYPGLSVRPFGSDVLSVSELMKWAKDNKYTLPDSPPLHDYDFVQIEGLLGDVQREAAERFSLEDAEIRIGTPTAEERANPRLLKPGEHTKMFPQWAVAGDVHVHWRKVITDAIQAGQLTAYDGASLFPKDVVKVANDPSGEIVDDWVVKAKAIADRIGLERWNSGVQEITAHNICKAVAKELADDRTAHGKRGARAANTVRTAGLKKWKFKPPSKRPG